MTGYLYSTTNDSGEEFDIWMSPKWIKMKQLEKWQIKPYAQVQLAMEMLYWEMQKRGIT